MRVMVLIMATFWATLMTSEAMATTYSVRFCAKANIFYDDVDSSVGDDHWTDNAVDQLLYGARVRVQRNSDGLDVYYDYTSYSGTYIGCTPLLNLSSTENYAVKVYSEAYVNGNYVTVRDNSSSDTRYNFILSSYYTPTASKTEQITTNQGNAWNITAASAFALSRFWAGLSGKTFTFYNSQNENCSGSCLYLGKVYLSTDGADSKYIITHEMGHAVAYHTNGGFSANSSYVATLDNCYTVSTRSHEMVSKEYNSSAANEGIAHFYAAITWNSPSYSDCQFEYYKTVDYDLDSNLDDQTTGCECEPNDGIGDCYDYLGDICSGTLANRGTEYDWLRFFWDMKTDQALSVSEIFGIWDEAHPWTWNQDDSGSSSDDPAVRLRDAANTLGFLTEWDNEDNLNGVHR